MKFLSLTLLSLVLLSSCSKSERKDSEILTEYMPFYTESLIISQNNQTDIEIINWGAFDVSTIKTKRILIKNETSAPITINDIGEAINSADEFSALNSVEVIQNKCSNPIIAVGASCFIDVRVSYNTDLHNTPINILVSGDTFETGAQIQFLMTMKSDNIQESDERLSISSAPLSKVVAGAVYTRRIIIKNLSELNSFTFFENTLSDLLDFPFVSITKNTCDGKTIPKNKSCFVDIIYEPTQDNQSTVLNLEIPGSNLNKIITLGPPPITPSEEVLYAFDFTGQQNGYINVNPNYTYSNPTLNFFGSGNSLLGTTEFPSEAIVLIGFYGHVAAPFFKHNNLNYTIDPQGDHSARVHIMYANLNIPSVPEKFHFSVVINEGEASQQVFRTTQDKIQAAVGDYMEFPLAAGLSQINSVKIYGEGYTSRTDTGKSIFISKVEVIKNTNYLIKHSFDFIGQATGGGYQSFRNNDTHFNTDFIFASDYSYAPGGVLVGVDNYPYEAVRLIGNYSASSYEINSLNYSMSAGKSIKYRVHISAFFDWAVPELSLKLTVNGTEIFTASESELKNAASSGTYVEFNVASSSISTINSIRLESVGNVSGPSLGKNFSIKRVEVLESP